MRQCPQRLSWSYLKDVRLEVESQTKNFGCEFSVHLTYLVPIDILCLICKLFTFVNESYNNHRNGRILKCVYSINNR